MVKRPIENRAYLQVPKCTPDSLEISMIKIESLGGLNQLRSTSKKNYMNVKFIRCDDAGENMAMKNDQGIKSFGVKFEFSGPRTPQRNGMVERKFQTFYGRIRSMLNGAGSTGDLRNKIWAECVMLDCIVSSLTQRSSNSINKISGS